MRALPPAAPVSSVSSSTVSVMSSCCHPPPRMSRIASCPSPFSQSLLVPLNASLPPSLNPSWSRSVHPSRLSHEPRLLHQLDCELPATAEAALTHLMTMINDFVRHLDRQPSNVVECVAFLAHLSDAEMRLPEVQYLIIS
jgi:hypothetical protein